MNGDIIIWMWLTIISFTLWQHFNFTVKQQLFVLFQGVFCAVLYIIVMKLKGA